MTESDFQNLAPGRRKPVEAQDLDALHRLHEDFLAQWLQALRVLLPASVGLQLRDLSAKTYGQFLGDCPPVLDIEVFEVQAWQSLCAWCLDGRWSSVAVDCLFGGGARLPLKGLEQRRPTGVEVGVRRRLLDSLASSYEAAWAATHPIRLHSLRSEDKLVNLRVASAGDAVLHLQLELQINALQLPVHACLPMRCLQWVRPAGTETAALASWPEAAPALATAGGGLMRAPVELQAVLAHTELTVAQLMALSVGQVVPLQMHDPVPLRVQGVSVGSAHHGVRNGRYAVRVLNLDASACATSQGPADPALPERGPAASEQAQAWMSAIDLELGGDGQAEPVKPSSGPGTLPGQ